MAAVSSRRYSDLRSFGVSQSNLAFLCTLAEGRQRIFQRPFTIKVFEDDLFEVGDS